MYLPLAPNSIMLLTDFNEHVLKEGLLLPIGCIAIKSTRGEEEGEEDVVGWEELNFNTEYYSIQGPEEKMQLGGRSSSTSSTEAAKAAAALHLHNKLELLLNHSQAVALLTLDWLSTDSLQP